MGYKQNCASWAQTKLCLTGHKQNKTVACREQPKLLPMRHNQNYAPRGTTNPAPHGAQLTLLPMGHNQNCAPWGTTKTAPCRAQPKLLLVGHNQNCGLRETAKTAPRRAQPKVRPLGCYSSTSDTCILSFA